MREITYIEAIREALQEEMRRDSSVFLLGEDIGLYGGSFGVTKNLVNEFGKERVRNTPMSEAAITGAATGAALAGMRPVAELMFMDFISLVIDQLQNNAASFRYISNGQLKVPLVIRTPSGSGRGYGATHSKSLEAFLMNIPGLIIVTPSTPHDAKGLLKSAIREDNPVVFIEHKLLYGLKGEVPEKDLEKDYVVPIGKAEVKKKGKDVTIVAHLKMNHLALEAAEELEKTGVDAEVIDPRTLKPLDFDTIAASVKKTNKLMIVEEGFRTGGIGAEISAQISEKLIDYLDAPIIRLGGEDLPIPCCPSLEKNCIPTKELIINNVKKLMAYKSYKRCGKNER